MSITEGEGGKMRTMLAWVLLVVMLLIVLVSGRRYIRMFRYYRRHDYLALMVCGPMIVGVTIVYPLVIR
jgi:uncharacterized membrane protein YidH (DUF202 family)